MLALGRGFLLCVFVSPAIGACASDPPPSQAQAEAESELDALELDGKADSALGSIKGTWEVRPVVAPSPTCGAIGSRSEGWYDAEGGTLLCWAPCADAGPARCSSIGSRSEGWYADPGKACGANGLIAWSQCDDRPTFLTLMNDGRFRSERPATADAADVEVGTATTRRRSGKTYLTLRGAGDAKVSYEWKLEGEALMLRKIERGATLEFVAYSRSDDARCSAAEDCEAQGATSLLACVGAWACEANSCRFDCSVAEEPRRCGGIAGVVCEEDEYCDYVDSEGGESSCGLADEMGECTQRPTSCPRNIDPVCGCDGMTHTNDCNARAAGTDVRAKGSCE